jgi:hypothetical protein
MEVTDRRLIHIYWDELLGFQTVGHNCWETISRIMKRGGWISTHVGAARCVPRLKVCRLTTHEFGSPVGE